MLLDGQSNAIAILQWSAKRGFYVDGYDGRLMRSMKSLLGSSLLEQGTDVGGGHAVRYLDVVTGYLRHLRHTAELALGAAIPRALLGVDRGVGRVRQLRHQFPRSMSSS